MIKRVRSYNVTGIILGVVGLAAFGYSIFEADRIASLIQMLMGLILVFWSDVTGPLIEDLLIEYEEGGSKDDE